MSTIKDVAEYAGLSVATISKYLNGGAVKDENRRRIQSAIETLNYQVNPFARSLKTRKSHYIGVLMPSSIARFFHVLLAAMDPIFREKGYNTLISYYNETAGSEICKLEALLQSGIDGLVYFPECMDDKAFYELVGKRKLPVVLADRLVSGVDADAVILHNSAAIYEAAELLIAKGHRRIGFISAQRHIFTAKERYLGLERAMTDYGIPIDWQLIKLGAYTVSDGYRLFKELTEMKELPTAILTTNYDLTLGAITAAKDCGITLPKDIDFFGFDCSDICRLMNPPICTVEQPEVEIGTQVARLLMERVEGSEVPPRLVRLKAHLNCFHEKGVVL